MIAYYWDGATLQRHTSTVDMYEVAVGPPTLFDIPLDAPVGWYDEAYRAVPPGVDVFAPARPRTAGGKGSGNFGHKGRPGEVGGSSREGFRPEPVPEAERLAEGAKQQALADAQTNPLAHPPFVLGIDNNVRYDELQRYIAAYGQEFKAAPRPANMRKDPDKQCYRNSSLHVLSDPTLRYAEGYATSEAIGGLTIMYAWAVAPDGTVIDSTWRDPEKNHYFGVVYDSEKYLAHIVKTGMYGVLSNTDANAQHAIDTGGKDLR